MKKVRFGPNSTVIISPSLPYRHPARPIYKWNRICTPVNLQKCVLERRAVNQTSQTLAQLSAECCAEDPSCEGVLHLLSRLEHSKNKSHLYYCTQFGARLEDTAD